MMDKHKKHFQKHAIPGSSEDTKKGTASQFGFNHWLEMVDALKTIPVVAGICQFILGMAIIVVAVLGFIRSLGMSVFLGISGGAATMAGIYFCYSAIIEHTSNTLLRDAMRRITENKN